MKSIGSLLHLAMLGTLSFALFLTGCSSINPRPPLAQYPIRDVSTSVHTNSTITPAEAQTLMLSLNPYQSSYEPHIRTPRLRLVMAPPSNDSVPAETAPSANSLFSWDYWKLVGLDIKETFLAPATWQTREWLIAGGITAGIGVTMAFDEDIQRAVQRNRNRTVDNVFNAVEPFGEAYAPAVMAAFYAGGEIFNDNRAKAVALDGLSATIISELMIEPLKLTVGRDRPNTGRGAFDFQPFSGNESFPSGHTTEAFVLATAIAEHYESLWIKVGAYGVASMVGYARMNNQAHWASDVLAGAALGTFISHTVVKFNARYRNFAVAPIIGPRMEGIQLVWRF